MKMARKTIKVLIRIFERQWRILIQKVMEEFSGKKYGKFFALVILIHTHC